MEIITPPGRLDVSHFIALICDSHEGDDFVCRMSRGLEAERWMHHHGYSDMSDWEMDNRLGIRLSSQLVAGHNTGGVVYFPSDFDLEWQRATRVSQTGRTGSPLSSLNALMRDAVICLGVCIPPATTMANVHTVHDRHVRKPVGGFTPFSFKWWGRWGCQELAD